MSRAPGSPWRRFVAAGALAVCACVLALIPASGAGASARVDATELYVSYTGPTTVQVMVGGQAIRSGGSIAPGLYTVIVYDNGFNASPRLLMSGPGVSISSDLNPSGMGVGVDGGATFGPYTFPANASYTVQQQGGAAVTFTTTAGAGGTSAGAGGTSGGAGGTSGGAGSGGSSSGGSSSGGSSSGGSSSGSTGTSSGVTTMGTLQASVSVSGKGGLTFGGKTPKTLKAGRYTVKVDDRSKQAGLVVGQATRRPTTLSAASAVGKSSHALTLTSGKWYFAVSAAGAKTYFTVK